MKAAFIGLGIMGSRMAAHLLEKGVDLTVFNRSALAVENLEKHGAQKANSPAEAVAGADIVFSMLASPQAVEEVFLQDAGALQYMKPNSLWVDCSTVNPEFSKLVYEKCKKKGIAFLEAPVAGSKPQAKSAELVFFVGGSSNALNNAAPFLEMMGKKIIHLGEVGKAASYKLVVNSLLAGAMHVFAESLAIGCKLGFDKDFLLDTLPMLPVVAPFVQAKADMIRQDDYPPQFPLELLVKDLGLLLETADSVGYRSQSYGTIKEAYDKLSQDGLGRKDFAAIAKVN